MQPKICRSSILSNVRELSMRLGRQEWGMCYKLCASEIVKWGQKRWKLEEPKVKDIARHSSLVNKNEVAFDG